MLVNISFISIYDFVHNVKFIWEHKKFFPIPRKSYGRAVYGFHFSQDNIFSIRCICIMNPSIYVYFRIFMYL